MGHGHAHHHDHKGGGHAHHGHHAPADFGRAFAIGITLNLIFVAIEAGFGIYSNSMALLSDAGHNLSDVLGLAVAWGGATLARRPSSKRFTWGYRSSSILAALANALLLLVAVGAIALEAVQRLFAPTPVAGGTMMLVAAVGIVINLGTAMLFAKGSKDDINIRGAFLHMASDAAVSAAVVVAGALVLWSGLILIDPIISLGIAALIFWQSWGLLVQSVSMALGAVPDGVQIDVVEELLGKQPGVARVHDLHIWPMSTTEIALSAHLIMPGGHPGDGFLHQLTETLRAQHRIAHVTIQIEQNDALCATPF